MPLLRRVSNIAVPAYKAPEVVIPPWAAIAAVMTVSSSFPYSLSSRTVSAAKWIRVLVWVSKMAATARVPANSTVFPLAAGTIRRQDTSMDTATKDKQTPAASRSWGCRVDTALHTTVHRSFPKLTDSAGRRA